MTTSTPELHGHARADDAKPLGTRLGISMSGGGIRSAAYSLGVYQRLAEDGLVVRARYLSAVSGGGYLAAALAISHALSPPELVAHGPAPWCRRSPEEDRLRRNLAYLAPGNAGRLWLAANLAYGLILNLLPLLLSSFLLGRIYGLALHAVAQGITTSKLQSAPIIAAAEASGVMTFLAIAVVGIRRFRDRGRSRPRYARSPRAERYAAVCLTAALILAALGVVCPIAVHMIAQQTKIIGLLQHIGLAGEQAWVRQGVLGVGCIGASLLAGLVAVALLQRRRLRKFRGMLALAGGLGILLTPFLLATGTAAQRGARGTNALNSVLCGLVLLILAVFSHNRRYSMHLFYRERIQTAFATYRRADVSGEPRIEIQEISHDSPVLLSDVAERNRRNSADGRPFPELIMCAAVAVRDRESAFEAAADYFTFEGHRSGNERLGLLVDTTALEEDDWVGAGGLTLPSLMAISGAAVSPIMGRYTVPAFRLLMALMNVRLGVWIPNPAKATVERKRDLRKVGKVIDYLWRGWLEPGGWWVLREALGLAGVRARYLHVSDGGHWENLGMVELLRRHCTHVVVIDASGDPSLTDVARAISIARNELGVEVHLDLANFVTTDGDLPASPVAVGSIHYADGDVGDIYYLRCALWPEAPTDLAIYAEHDRPFPLHPTSNQFMPGDRFDAYRALGWHAAQCLARLIRLPPPQWDERRTDVSDVHPGDPLPPFLVHPTRPDPADVPELSRSSRPTPS